MSPQTPSEDAKRRRALRRQIRALSRPDSHGEKASSDTVARALDLVDALSTSATLPPATASLDLLRRVRLTFSKVGKEAHVAVVVAEWPEASYFVWHDPLGETGAEKLTLQSLAPTLARLEAWWQEEKGAD